MPNALDLALGKSKGKIIGYIRVSTVDQNTDRQLEGVTLDKVFTDKVSGRDTNRPALKACLEFLREDDTLKVHSMDRLARNVDDLRRIVRELTGRGVTVHFLKENLTFSPNGASSPFDQLMLTMLGAFAEFERNLIRERQREGIALAKQRGAYKGRKPKLNKEQADKLRERVAAGIPKATVAREFGLARQTLYEYLLPEPG